MKRRSSETFKVGQRVKTKEGHEAVVLHVWDTGLKVDFITGPREGMLPLVDHISKFEPV